ncbi:hypothetical protein Pla8534_71010 [Lignipirellula cremea]|uniref:Uncharacterized protein n=1 Tax=Lignipirellula cremea TaxID=2528010 RepID=A0A518E538_9BACT|nr:hypothetical protein Pla8534_71010 [Lignipirellula cremea]
MQKRRSHDFGLRASAEETQPGPFVQVRTAVFEKSDHLRLPDLRAEVIRFLGDIFARNTALLSNILLGEGAVLSPSILATVH